MHFYCPCSILIELGFIKIKWVYEKRCLRLRVLLAKTVRSVLVIVTKRERNVILGIGVFLLLIYGIDFFYEVGGYWLDIWVPQNTYHQLVFPLGVLGAIFFIVGFALPIETEPESSLVNAIVQDLRRKREKND